MSSKMNTLSIGGTKSRQKLIALDEKSVVDDDTCVVCFTSGKVFSIGECDHPVCYICSTRMRVLCKQNECPICRHDMSQVIFTTEKLPFRQLEIKYRTGLYDKKYRIRFATSKGQNDFQKLFENQCPRCPAEPFLTFELLRDHIRKEHEMFYCDLCTDNLKIFSSERKCYTRTELGIHRRKGDTDNKSHRGHPLCKYCDCRFLDKDELFRHMRREHYLCHLCDADGSNQFYANILAMRDHFRKEHYLCEEGDCAQENFTSVFRTDIDLRAHVASVHGRTMSKLANKQTRTLDLEFTLAPRYRQPVDNGTRFPGRSRQYPDNQNEFDVPEETFQTPQPIIDARNEQEFPSLGGANSGSAPSNFSMQPSLSIRTKAFGASGLARTKENFPALGKSNQESNSINNNGSSNYKQGMASALLRGKNNAAPPKVVPANASSEVIHISNRPQKQADNLRSNAQEFPSLPGTSNHKKSNLETDFVSPASAFAMSALAAKHRNLVDGYESLQQTEPNTKISIVQKQNSNAAKNMAEKVPKLNSNDNFPALGRAQMGANNLSTPAWLSAASNKQPRENRKPSTAPSTLVNTAASNNNNNNNVKMQPLHMKNQDAGNTKAPSTNTKPDTANTKGAKSSNQAINGKKDKTQKPIANKKDSEVIKHPKKQRDTESANEDEQQSDFDLSNVMHAVSAKHRGIIYSYESHNPKTDKKINISKDTATTISEKKTENKYDKAPKLNSMGLFPSLSKQKSTENNNNTVNFNKNIKNFSDIIKADTTKSNANSTTESIDPNENDATINYVTSDIRELNTNDPPPGFGANSPPPGFNTITLNSVAKPLTDLTFTTSLGESFNILPSYTYMPPPNAVQRNKELVTHFHNILKESDVVEQFKQISQNFMTGSYFAQPYYEHCTIALGDKFIDIFPELLVLLPDISKQQELYLVHSQEMKGNTRKNKRMNALEVCSICKQVLVAGDVDAHAQMHVLENNFPTLKGHGSQTIIANSDHK